MPRLGIVIPVYNEADNIEKTLATIRSRICEPMKIYIVYDFDEDDTLPVVRQFMEDGWDICLINNHVGGVVSALKLGLRSVQEEFVLVVMADMSDDLAVVDKMIQKMEQGNDVVCGSRYMPGGKQIGGPLIKKTLSRMAGVSLKHLTGIPTHDITNSFKLYRRTVLDQFDLESNGGFEIGMEIVVKSYICGNRIAEIPSTWRDRTSGVSRFRVAKWLPNYLRWYLLAINHSWRIFLKRKMFTGSL